jgi:hypothetical protein
MPMIDVTARAGTFSNKRELTPALTAALMRSDQVPTMAPHRRRTPPLPTSPQTGNDHD